MVALLYTPLCSRSLWRNHHVRWRRLAGTGCFRRLCRRWSSLGWSCHCRFALPAGACGLTGLCSVGEDLGHPHERELLPMPTLSARVLPPPFLESDDLRPASLLQHLSRNRSAGDAWRAERDLVAAD